MDDDEDPSGKHATTRTDTSSMPNTNAFFDNYPLLDVPIDVNDAEPVPPNVNDVSPVAKNATNDNPRSIDTRPDWIDVD